MDKIGFAVIGNSLQLIGICPKCLEQEKQHK